ncbi:MAG TPA: uroporphyrinogen-III synthase [Symbiobacteriaceae bacterium]|jgi:uroporphyrinogen III methyltransferase/synthase
MAEGMVFLVGTTPGDPGLMTVRGLQAIRRADLLVYDPGVSQSLLGEAGPAASKLAVVEPGAVVAMLMAGAAAAGRTVCRLYAGGPLLSGAAEEAPALAARGLALEIIPCVLPELAAPVYAGVGLGRPMNLALVDAAAPNIAWPQLATGVATISARLDVAQLPAIAGQLMAHGRPADTPVAVIVRGTYVDQRTVTSTLSRVGEAVAEAGLQGEAVAVIGWAATKRPELNWYETKPLFGRCVLVTRARSQASSLVDRLADVGGRTFEFPAIVTKAPESYGPLDAAIAAIETYRWVVVTSPNGAEHFQARLMASGRDVRALAHLKVAAVGTATAKALACAGIRADLVPPEFRGAALPAAMAPLLRPGDRVLMARANLADPAVAADLRALGAVVDDVVAYRTLLEGGDVAGLQAALRRGEIHYATFTSSSTVTSLLERLGGREPLAGVRIACMGPETKKAAEAVGLTVHVLARQVTIDGLVNAIVEDARTFKEAEQ